MRIRRRQDDVVRADPDRVALLVDGVGTLHAFVRGARNGVADLALDPPVPAGFLDGRAATLVAIGDRRLEGVLELGWSRGHVRFLRSDVQRRAWTRAPVEHEALVITDRLDAMWRARTVDLSAGGALLGEAADLPLGAHLELLLQVEGDANVRAPGRVVRAPSERLRAIRFEALSHQERLRLARLVAVEHVRRINGEG
jgi:hypothetical protein